MNHNISSILKQLRKTSGYSANEVVELLKGYNIEISAKTLYGYESGLSMPNADVFIVLCKIYKCDNPLDIFGNTSIKPDEMRLLEKFRELDDLGREAVLHILDVELRRSLQLVTIYACPENRHVTQTQLKEINREVHDDATPTSLLNAAHARTDITPAAGVDTSDDDIMDDPDF